MTDAALEHAQPVRRPARRVLLGSVRELALLPAIAVLFVAGIFASPAFLTTANFSNTAQFSAALGLVVVAESLILLTGSFDLSLQSIYGLAPMIGAWLIVPKDAEGLGTNWNPAFGILVVVGIVWLVMTSIAFREGSRKREKHVSFGESRTADLEGRI